MEPMRGQMNAVGAHGESDIEAIVHDKKAGVASSDFAQRHRQCVDAGAAAIAHAELHRHFCPEARGPRGGEDRVVRGCIVRDDAEDRRLKDHGLSQSIKSLSGDEAFA
jgi:hypothetical protein